MVNWRCLLKRLDISVGGASELVAVYCTLHICEVHDDTFDDDWLNGVDSQEIESSSSCSSSLKIKTCTADVCVHVFS